MPATTGAKESKVTTKTTISQEDEKAFGAMVAGIRDEAKRSRRGDKAKEEISWEDVAEAESVDKLYDLLAGLNGAQHTDPDRQILKFLPMGMAMRVPECLLPDFTAQAHPGVTVDDLRILSTVLSDEHRKCWSSHGRIWSPPDEKISVSRLHILSRQALIHVAACNVSLYGGSALMALRAAYALSFGLVNIGGDGYEREWVSYAAMPSFSDYSTIFKFIGGLRNESGLMVDLIALVGYIRLSRTHILTSNDDRKEAAGHVIDFKLTNRIIATTENEKIVIDVGAKNTLLYNSVHAFSMGGAIGFYGWALRNRHLGLHMRIRTDPFGDTWKLFAIALAVYSNMSFVPMLGVALSPFEPMRQSMIKYVSQAGFSFVRTSSLSRMLCGKDPVPIPQMYMPFINMLSAMGAGAAQAKFIPSSIGTAYAIKRIGQQQSALVRIWRELFEGLSDRLTTTPLTEVVKGIADASGLLAAGRPAEGKTKAITVEEVAETPKQTPEAGKEKSG